MCSAIVSDCEHNLKQSDIMTTSMLTRLEWSAKGEFIMCSGPRLDAHDDRQRANGPDSTKQPETNKIS